jgi:histidyl-tRNA synthetase
MSGFKDGVVAVICSDPMRAVVVASEIRRANIPCETYYSTNIKKQMKKSADLEAVILVFDNGIYIKDMLSGNQRQVQGDLVDAVQYVLTEGYYDD